MRRVLIAFGAFVVLTAGVCLWLIYDWARHEPNAARSAYDSAVDAALNGSGGPDYVRAIAIYRQSPEPAERREIWEALAILSSCREVREPCRSAGPGQALTLLQRQVHSTDLEISSLARDSIARAYANGAGAAVAKDALRAACWTYAAKRPGTPTKCY